MILSGVTLAFGQTADGKSLAPNPNPPRTESDFILQQLQGSDAELTEALARIKVLVNAGVRVYPKWLAILFEKGRYDDVEAVCIRHEDAHRP